MNASTERIYLDNAATSWPKPESVYQAVDHYQRQIGAAAGRGAYRQAAEVERLVEDARHRIGQLIGAPIGRPVIFTCNGTDALNLALHGVLRPNDHVITTESEHNSVLRPLRELERHRGVELSIAACDDQGVVDPDSIRQAIRSRTRLIAMLHASNVTGAVQPVAEVGRIASEHGLLFLVDAAQTVGHLPLDVQSWHIDLLAAPGHKGLLGPLGTGFLYIAPDVLEQVRPIRHGGTGTRSESEHHPESYPEGFEAGNLNVPGIAGLRAGAAFIAEQGWERLRRHEKQLTETLLEGLKGIPQVSVLGPADADRRLGVVSISVEGYDPQEVAAMLDAAHGIQVRSGLHCAARIHARLGTLARGGAVRFSTGPFNTVDQISCAIEAVAGIAASTAF